MKTTGKLILLYATASIIFTACKKESQQSVNQPGQGGNLTTAKDNSQQRSGCPATNGITCSDGLLVFDGYDNFKLVVEDIQDAYDDTANDDTTNTETQPQCFESNFNYTSLRSVLFTAHTNALANEVYDPSSDIFYHYVPHTGIRTVCNSNGEVLIGQELHIFTNQGDEFIVHNGDRSFTAQINNGDFTTLDGVTQYAYNGSVTDYNNGTAIVIIPFTTGDCKPWTKIKTKTYANNKKMLVLSTWVGNTAYLNTSGSDVTAFRKVLGGWVPMWTDNLYVDYAGNYRNKFCNVMAGLSGNQGPNWAHYRRAANDIFTPNGFANNVFRAVGNGEFGGNASASGCSLFNATLW